MMEAKIREKYFNNDEENLTSSNLFNIFSEQLLSKDFLRELDQYILIKDRIDFEAGIYARILFFFEMTNEYRINVSNYLKFCNVYNAMKHIRLKDFVNFFTPVTNQEFQYEYWRKQIKKEWSYSYV